MKPLLDNTVLLDEFDGPELPMEQPPQKAEVAWEPTPRRNPRWGTVTREGLIVGRGDRQRVIHPDDVYNMARYGCSHEEMADFFRVDSETLRYNFREYIRRGQADTRARLRKAQLELALSGNTTMLIWLGKQILGQTDQPMTSNTDRVLPWTAEDAQE